MGGSCWPCTVMQSAYSVSRLRCFPKSLRYSLSTSQSLCEHSALRTVLASWGERWLLCATDEKTASGTWGIRKIGLQGITYFSGAAIHKTAQTQSLRRLSLPLPHVLENWALQFAFGVTMVLHPLLLMKMTEVKPSKCGRCARSCTGCWRQRRQEGPVLSSVTHTFPATGREKQTYRPLYEQFIMY